MFSTSISVIRIEKQRNQKEVKLIKEADKRTIEEQPTNQYVKCGLRGI